MKKNYTVKLEKKEWEEILDKVFNKRKKEIKVDGFRKGQISKDTYIKKFGIESLYMDAVDEAVPALYKKLLDDKNTIVPACRPTIDIKKISADELEIEFTLVSVPDVKLGKYKDLKLKKEEAKVTKEEIKHEIDHLLNEYADMKVLEDGEKIKNGHTAVIDFEGFVDGKAFEGGKGVDHNLVIGSGQFIPGFEEQLIGLSKNDTKDVVVTFPENYPSENLKGKEAVFKVKVNDIKERVLPELNEEFFKDLGEGIKSLEDLEREIETNIKLGKERRINDEYVSSCLDKVVENSKFELPDEMIEDEVERLVHEFEHQLSHQGMNMETYLKFTNSTMDSLKEQLKGEATKRLGYRLVIDAVIDKETFEIDKNDVEKYIKESCEKYKVSKEDFLKEIGGEDTIIHDLKAKKSLEIITGISNLE